MHAKRDEVKNQLPSWLVDAYGQTVFEVHLPSGHVRLGAGITADGGLANLPATPLTVITGYNPLTDRPGYQSNEKANERLKQVLQELGKSYHPAVGYSRDRSHSEPSFAVEDLSREEAQALGEMFHQACVFYWDRGIGRLLWCEGSSGL